MTVTHKLATQLLAGVRPVEIARKVSEKRTIPGKARDLYTSNWFLKARDYG
jgi:hypothetical protein